MSTEKEKYCESCDEDWPADSQFWFQNRSRSDKLSSYCKACYYENIRPAGSRSKTPSIAVPRPTDALAHLLTLQTSAA